MWPITIPTIFRQTQQSPEQLNRKIILDSKLSYLWPISAGQLSHAPVAMATNLTNTLKALKERGFFVVGLAGDTAQSLPEASLGDVPVVLVVGAEGAGLSRLVRETCDMVVAIPLDPRTESLNAAVACGIALYEISRQRAS